MHDHASLVSLDPYMYQYYNSNRACTARARRGRACWKLAR